MTRAKAAGVDCFVIEFGATEAAQARGNRAQLRNDIDTMLRHIGPDYRVDWITPYTKVFAGNWSDSNMRAMRVELDAARGRYRNLDVNHWERVPETLSNWWRPDYIHLHNGSKVRGPYIVESAFRNGSR